MEKKPSIIFETIKSSDGTVDARGLDSSAETIETQREASIDLDSKTLEFLRDHIDITTFHPRRELWLIRDFLKTLPSDLQSKSRRILINNFKLELKEIRHKR